MSHVQKNTQQQERAESDRDLEMRRAQFKMKTNKANEEADVMQRINRKTRYRLRNAHVFRVAEIP
jgi:hypothetical protein